MDDPFVILGLSPDADDGTIRTRYLALVRENPPERAPERFAAIRNAYEQVKDLETRLNKRLFTVDNEFTIQTLIEELACKSSRPRISLAKLVAVSTAK